MVWKKSCIEWFGHVKPLCIHSIRQMEEWKSLLSAVCVPPAFLWYLHPLYSSFLFPLFEANCSWKPWFDVPCVSDFFIFFFFFVRFCFVFCVVYILRAVKYKDLFWSTDNVYTSNWDTPYCQFCVYLTLYGIRNFQSLSYFTSHLIWRLYMFYIFSSCIALRLCKSKVNPDIAEQFSHYGEVGSYCNTAKLDLPKFRQKRI